MVDNTQISAGSGGDTIRDKDRSGVKTQITALDLNPAGASEVLMSAAALADATANPTTAAFGSLCFGFNGSTWDRLQVDGSKNLRVGGSAASGATATGNPVLVGGKDGSGNAQSVATDTSGNQTAVGNVASGATDSGAPVKVGGKANSSAPSAVIAGQRVDLWCDLNGRPVVGTVAAALADSTSNPTTPLVGVCPLVWDPGASSWSRQQGNSESLAFSSAARTTGATVNISNVNARGIAVYINVTAASGTGGLTVRIQARDGVTVAYYNLNAAPAAITATGEYIYILYPGIGAAVGDVTQTTNGVLPKNCRIAITVGDSSSYTYSGAYNLLV